MSVVHEGETVWAPDKNAQNLRELDAARAENEGTAKLVEPSGKVHELPHSLYEVILDVLDLVGQGKGVKVLPADAELTTQQAANLLNVSRPFLVKLLDNGEIDHRKVGTHRRVKLVDLMVYKERRDSERNDLLDDIANESQELGLYDVEDEE